MEFLFSGFGYELWIDKSLEAVNLPCYIVLQGDGEQVGPTDKDGFVCNFDSTFEAKKWMKANKTSTCWCADGTWDWSRLEVLEHV